MVNQYTQPLTSGAHLPNSRVLPPPKLQVLAGLVLNATSWAVAWAGPEPIRYHTFFPLWFGFILVVDGASRWLFDTSLMQRLRRRIIWLFVVSIPIWWIFEIANNRLGNWVYILPREYSWLRYHAEASLAFSTVVPAILVTAEFARSFLPIGPVQWIRIDPTKGQLATISGIGALLFTATMLWPGIFFPMVWISLFMAIDPIVNLIGGRSISGQVGLGRWDTVLVLFIATLFCGFFWEFWNFWSMPKWTYEISYADWFRIFEMPALGYGGYFPFGLEIYGLVALADRVLGLGLGSAMRFDRARGES